MHCYQQKVIPIVLFIIVTIKSIIRTKTHLILIDTNQYILPHIPKPNPNYKMFLTARILFQRWWFKAFLIFFPLSYFLPGKRLSQWWLFSSSLRLGGQPCLLQDIPPILVSHYTTNAPMHYCTALHCTACTQNRFYSLHSDCPSKFKLNPLLSALISAQLQNFPQLCTSVQFPRK